MRIKELSALEFQEFASCNPLASYMQTEEYAYFMRDNKYNFDFIGLVNDSDQILAASLILIKKINFNTYYGYAPKGFLINYYDNTLLKTFTEELKKYYQKKNIVFIKINPEIVIGEIDNKTFEFIENPNNRLKQDIQRYGFIKLKDNLYFESLNPRFNAYIDLKNIDLSKYSKANRNKVKNSNRKGLYIEKGSIDNLQEYCEMGGLKDKIHYYRSLFSAFKDEIELIMVKVNFENFIKNSQQLYDEESEHNSLFNEILHRSNKESDLHRKMDSDSKLSILKQEIITATDGLRDNNNRLVAAAIVIKFHNRVHVVESIFDRNYGYLNANYFLYDSLIKNYKTDFEFLDLGGISGDFKKSSPYRGLNNFKIGFGASIFEYIGEFDFVINRTLYDGLLMSGRLANEFNKKIK